MFTEEITRAMLGHGPSRLAKLQAEYERKLNMADKTGINIDPVRMLDVGHLVGAASAGLQHVRGMSAEESLEFAHALVMNVLKANEDEMRVIEAMSFTTVKESDS